MICDLSCLESPVVALPSVTHQCLESPGLPRHFLRITEIIPLVPPTDSAKYSPDPVAPCSVILRHPSQLRALFPWWCRKFLSKSISCVSSSEKTNLQFQLLFCWGFIPTRAWSHNKTLLCSPPKWSCSTGPIRQYKTQRAHQAHPLHLGHVFPYHSRNSRVTIYLDGNFLACDGPTGKAMRWAFPKTVSRSGSVLSPSTGGG